MNGGVDLGEWFGHDDCLGGGVVVLLGSCRLAACWTFSLSLISEIEMGDYGCCFEGWERDKLRMIVVRHKEDVSVCVRERKRGEEARQQWEGNHGGFYLEFCGELAFSVLPFLPRPVVPPLDLFRQTGRGNCQESDHVGGLAGSRDEYIIMERHCRGPQPMVRLRQSTWSERLAAR